MLSVILHGILIGLILAVLVGPVFLALMSVTLTQGKKKGYRFMAGNAVSDLTIAILAYNGILLWGGKHSIGGHFIGIVGACIFLAYGIYLLYKKETAKDVEVDTKTTKRHIGNFFLLVKGYVMNTLNPGIFIFWITILAQFVKKYHHPSPLTIKIFIACVLITFVLTDIFKVNSAHRILRKLTIKNMRIVDVVAGILMIFAGVLMLLRVIL